MYVSKGSMQEKTGWDHSGDEGHFSCNGSVFVPSQLWQERILQAQAGQFASEKPLLLNFTFNMSESPPNIVLYLGLLFYLFTHHSMYSTFKKQWFTKEK